MLRLALWLARSRSSQPADRSLDTGLFQLLMVSSSCVAVELGADKCCGRPVLVLLQFRDRRRHLQHQCRFGRAPRRHPAACEAPNPTPAEDHPGVHLRYGCFRDCSSNFDQSLFSRSESGFIRIPELVFPRSFCLGLCHQPSCGLGPYPRYLPFNKILGLSAEDIQ